MAGFTACAVVPAPEAWVELVDQRRRVGDRWLVAVNALNHQVNHKRSVCRADGCQR